MARRSRRDQRFIADINVTSLVDVMIVLLIMFMITAPMSQAGIDVRVPETEGAPLPASEAIVISMDADGRVFVDRTEIRPDALGQVLEQIRNSRGTERVYFRADESNSYGRVMTTMGHLREAGFEDVGLVPERPVVQER